jgi:hypothetical protein
MWSNSLLQALAGAFATNAIPHLVHGLSGQPFRTPFVRLRGKTQSGPVLNVVWGWANAAFAHWLATISGGSPMAFMLGALLAGACLALIFRQDRGHS